jgi:hypothetical protein
VPWEVAAGAFVSFVGQSAAPGGIVEGWLAPRGRRLGGRLAFLGAGTRDEPLGNGKAVWTRLAVAGGPRYTLQKGSFLISLYAEALLAAVLVRGVGYDRTYDSADLDLGLGGGARVGFRLGPIAPWIGGGVAGWLRPQEVQVDGLSATAQLPRFEVLLGGGLSLGKYP